MSVDPLAPEYPWYTPYQFAGNIPIRFIDIEGLEPGDPQNFRYSYIWFLKAEGNLAGAKNPAIGLVDGYWVFQMEHRVHPHHREYYYLAEGGNYVKFWDTYEVENQRREVWNESIDLLAQIYSFEMEIMLAGPEMAIEGIIGKGAEILAGQATRKLCRKFFGGVRQRIGRSPKAARSWRPKQVITNKIKRDKQVNPRFGKTLFKRISGISIKSHRLHKHGVPLDGQYEFVIMNNGEIRLGTGHDFLSQNADEVFGAGRARLVDGKFEYIDNNTGHFLTSKFEIESIGGYLKRKRLTSDNFKSIHLYE
ncbi:MAG: hypothetical protein AAGN35_17345 [Bacteroidota bacterium]